MATEKAPYRLLLQCILPYIGFFTGLAKLFFLAHIALEYKTNSLW